MKHVTQTRVEMLN